ncbi:hypothetical protein [Streptomyces sp. DB-54]
MTTAAPAHGTGGSDRAARSRHRPGPAAGLTWLIWRQHRGALLAGVVLLAAAIAIAAYQRAGAVAFINDHHLAGCHLADPSDPCWRDQDALMGFAGGFGAPLKFGAAACSLLPPLLVGVFLGAPLLSRDLESGTHRLAWLQSASRRQWLTAKLALPAAAVLFGSTLLFLVLRWWWSPSANELSHVFWYGGTAFPGLGPVLVGYNLLSLVLGAVAGLLIRRTVPAMAVTLASVCALLYSLSRLRPHLSSPLTMTGPGMDFSRLPGRLWPIDQGTLDSTGATAPAASCFDAVCQQQQRWVDYLPPDRFWALQGTETAICLALAAVLTAFAFYWIRRRPA